MIRAEKYSQALLALRRLIIHAKSQAYQLQAREAADLLNDLEMLPEYLADGRDRTDDFVEMLQGIAQAHPGCQYILDEFQRPASQPG